MANGSVVDSPEGKGKGNAGGHKVCQGLGPVWVQCPSCLVGPPYLCQFRAMNQRNWLVNGNGQKGLE
jgi:hypothetical protein